MPEETTKPPNEETVSINKDANQSFYPKIAHSKAELIPATEESLSFSTTHLCESLKEKDPILSTSSSPGCTAEKNLQITLILVTFGFFKAFKPSESFLYPYLSTTKGFSDDQINNQIFNIYTYSYLTSLVIVAVVTKFVGSKFVIFVEALCQLATRIILIWGSTLFEMQMMQVTFGFACAGEIAYFAYVYSLVEPKIYQRLTSLTRGAVLIGYMSASVLAQILVSYFHVEYAVLFYISLSSVIIATLTVFFFPQTPLVAQPISNPPPKKESLKNWIVSSAHRFRNAYSNPKIIRYSLWWSIAYTNVSNIENYGSSLWFGINSHVLYNGYVDASARGLAAFASLAPLFMVPFTNRFGESLFCFISLLMAILSFFMTFTRSIYVAYFTYILFDALAYFLISMGASQTASAMVSSDDYSFVFGWNAFFSVLIQTIMQFFLGSQGFNVDIFTRFIAFTSFTLAASIIAIATVFIVFAVPKFASNQTLV